MTWHPPLVFTCDRAISNKVSEHPLQVHLSLIRSPFKIHPPTDDADCPRQTSDWSTARCFCHPVAPFLFSRAIHFPFRSPGLLSHSSIEQPLPTFSQQILHPYWSPHFRCFRPLLPSTPHRSRSPTGQRVSQFVYSSSPTSFPLSSILFLIGRHGERPSLPIPLVDHVPQLPGAMHGPPSPAHNFPLALR